MSKSTNSKKPKTSSVRHTRAVALDRSKHQPQIPPPAQIEQLLNQVIQPLTFSLLKLYSDMGLRQRTLTLPVMLAFVLSLIWRRVPFGCGSVSEAVRVLAEDGMLWQPPLRVTQQAINTRLRQLPAALFQQVLQEILPLMHQRWQARQRPMPAQMQVALRHFKRVVAVDGSTLDALIKKVGLLREQEGTVLAGKMLALLDVASQLPVRIWYEEDSNTHEQRWWEQILEELKEDHLILFDLGFVNYERYRQMSESQRYFVSRVKSNMVYHKLKELKREKGLVEWLVQVGKFEEGNAQLLRLVELEYEGQSYNYITNVLDLARLSGEEIGWLYRQRWRIEDAFKTVKRLLGLAYFHSSSINAICLQVWASWILYSVLIDLVDEVAEELEQPFSRISVEMVYRGLYHYSQALARGETGSAAEYFASRAKLLGIIKAPRKKQLRP